MNMAIKAIKLKYPDVKNITTEDVHRLMSTDNSDTHDQPTTSKAEGTHPDKAQNRLILLDARPQEEFSVSHLVGARRVNPEGQDAGDVLRDIQQQTADGDTRPVTVVCYCSMGYRSSLYAHTLMSMMPSGQDSSIKIYNMEGSLFKWANEGRPYLVDSAEQPTIKVHPFNAVWGKLLKKDLRKSQPD